MVIFLLKTNSIYQGDCLDLLKEIPDASVDLILTDPPYCVGATSSGIKHNVTDLNLIKPFFAELFKNWARVLKDGGQIYINTDWRTYPILHWSFCQNFIMRNLLVWKHGLLRTGNWYRYSYELIIFGTKGDAKRTFGAGERDLIDIKVDSSALPPNRVHSSQKPVALLEYLIKNSSVAGDVVLDCFAGSGSTCVAAVNTDRQFIGIELDEHYFEVACDRVTQAQDLKGSEF